MSATIHWRKSSLCDPYLKKVWAPTSFIESLERAFDTFPCTLDDSAIPVLRGMLAVCGPQSNSEAYAELIQLIETHGAIELYATH